MVCAISAILSFGDATLPVRPCRGRTHHALVAAERGANDISGSAGAGVATARSLPQDRLHAPSRRGGGVCQCAAVRRTGVRCACAAQGQVGSPLAVVIAGKSAVVQVLSHGHCAAVIVYGV